MMCDGPLPKDKINPAERYEGLKDVFSTTANNMRDAIKTLPAEQQMLLAGKLEVLDVTFEAMVREFAPKPTR